MPATDTRVVVPDSHGAHVDWQAAKAMLADIKLLAPQEVVLLGDHLDCAGVFSVHQRSFTNELVETFDDDCEQANLLLDGLQEAAPNATVYYIEGNHEQHVERWATRQFNNRCDAEKLLSHMGPMAVLRLRDRGIRYYRRQEFYQNLSVPGTIRLGRCHFTHGWYVGANATAKHLSRAGVNVVHGHTHVQASHLTRTVAADAIGAWSPGTLAKLQPLYMHTAPTGWAHGYGVQFVARSGTFLHVNVPIVKGHSLLAEASKILRK